MNHQQKSILKNNKGLATFEALPLLVVFFVLTAYGIGLWGSIHTAILHSMGARLYAFETFRNRTNLNLFREDGGLGRIYMGPMGVRYHAVINGTNQNSDKFHSTPRPIAIGRSPGNELGNVQTHQQGIYGIGSRNREVGVSPMWIMVGYGICLNASCGGE